MSEELGKGLEDQLEALMIIERLESEKTALLQARKVNIPPNIKQLRDAFKNNKNVKSDVKKSSAFVKKIRSINTEGIQQCIRDTDTLNLTQYISEIVTAILATTYKATDVSHMVKLCISLHQKYDDFTEPLVTGLKQILIAAPTEEDVESGKKRRINIRFIVELHQYGVFVEDEFFCQLLRNLLGKGKM
jgi:regulator of nonsense transcripts 2